MSQPKILYSQHPDNSIVIRIHQHGKDSADKIVDAVKEALRGIVYRTIPSNSGEHPRIILTTNPTYNSVQIMDKFRATPEIFEERKKNKDGTVDVEQELEGLFSGTLGGGYRKSNKSSKSKKYKTTKNKKNKKSTKHKKTKKTKKNRR